MGESFEIYCHLLLSCGAGVRMKMEHGRRNLPGLGSLDASLAWGQRLPPQLPCCLSPQGMATTFWFGLCGWLYGTQEKPWPGKWEGGSLRESQADASKCRMSSLGVSLDSRLTPFPLLALGALLLLLAQMFAQMPSPLLQCLGEEEGGMRTLHLPVFPGSFLFFPGLWSGPGGWSLWVGQDKY